MPPSFSSPGTQWTLLVVASAGLAAVLEALSLPAALLVGPMIAAIALGTNGGTIRVSRAPYFFAQAVVSCLVARGITSDIVGTMSESGLLFGAVILGVLIASGGLGMLLMRLEVFPGTTAIWGCWPGAAAAMVLMGEAYGADARLVAFMQYLRVVLVSIVASVVARLWVDPATLHGVEVVWFPPVNWTALAGTLSLAVLGTIIGVTRIIPAGAFVVPLLIGSVLHATGLMDIELPPWLLAVCYALVGWNNGLNFTKQILAHAWRVLPQVFASIMALIALCGVFANLLHRYAGVDPLTAYLATSPGGADSVAIIAASTAVDVSFVMALQTLRFLVVLLLGPYLARFFAKRSQPVDDTPPPPLD